MSDDKHFYTNFFYIMGGLVVGCVVLIIIASNLTTDVAEYRPEEVVVSNIRPVGNVSVAGESGAEPAAAQVVAVVDTAPAEPRSGEEVYTSKCLACHSVGVAGAPKVGDAAAWATRVATGIDSMLANLKNGIGAMPPMGTCTDCSDEELTAGIEYMVANSQ